MLYSLIDGQERVIIESIFGDLLNFKYYDGPYETPSPYPFESVWETLARRPGCKKMASNLKSLSLRFLHHFITSTV